MHRSARNGEIYDRENELVILPPFTLREASENTKALSVSGLLNGERPRTSPTISSSPSPRPLTAGSQCHGTFLIGIRRSPPFRSGQYKNVRANRHSLVLVAAPSWNRSQRGIQIFLRTKCGDGTWGLPAGAIEPRTAWVISAEGLKVICYKCVKGGRNRPALIRDVNGNACTELLKNCLQNTSTREINGLKSRCEVFWSGPFLTGARNQEPTTI